MKLKILGKAKAPPTKKDKISVVDYSDEFPNVRLGSHKLPIIKDLKVGDKCQLIFEAEVTGLRKKDNYESYPEGTVHADFKLHKGDIHSANGKKATGKGPKSSEAAYNEGIEDLKDHEARKRLTAKMK